jgi:hypothetical protein
VAFPCPQYHFAAFRPNPRGQVFFAGTPTGERCVGAGGGVWGVRELNGTTQKVSLSFGSHILQPVADPPAKLTRRVWPFKLASWRCVTALRADAGPADRILD